MVIAISCLLDEADGAVCIDLIEISAKAPAALVS
jgi:hypothetical protein